MEYSYALEMLRWRGVSLEQDGKYPLNGESWSKTPVAFSRLELNHYPGLYAYILIPKQP